MNRTRSPTGYEFADTLAVRRHAVVNSRGVVTGSFGCPTDTARTQRDWQHLTLRSVGRRPGPARSISPWVSS